MANGPSREPPPGATLGWQQVHHLLAARAAQAPTLAELPALGLYYYQLYKALGHPADAAQAQRLLAGLATQLAQPASSTCLVCYADYACTLAWLSPHLAAAGWPVPPATASLAQIDQQLLPLALRAHTQPQGLGRGTFFRIVRYFDLRRPAAPALAALPLLLASPLFASPRPAAYPLNLDLADGLPAELLLASRLAQAGIGSHHLQQYVREGVQLLLTHKQAVDFSGGRYACFPYRVGDAQTAEFSPELSWRRGDLGQALLLRTASQLFADAELAGLAELVGLNTLLRTTPETTGIAGASFGRGAAGVAQLYYRLYAASNYAESYYQGYLFWLGETQRWLGQELAAGFYQARAATLREGLPGVGLVLLAAATGTGHDWDGLLL